MSNEKAARKGFGGIWKRIKKKQKKIFSAKRFMSSGQETLFFQIWIIDL